MGIFCLLAAAASPALGEEAPDSCVSCHRNVEGVFYLEHNFSDWEKSVHSKAGVSCASCHGGDPSQKDKKAAHRKVISSTDKNSPVYFTAVPETCGACHKTEFKAFKKSAHYKELVWTGRGPNCVTCHGSMANHVLQPREMEMTCTLCHRKPTQAYATMLSLGGTSSQMKKLKAAVEEAKAGKMDVREQEKEVRQVLDLYEKALVDFHTFKMPEVLRSSQEINRRAVNLLNELELKRLQQDGKRP